MLEVLLCATVSITQDVIDVLHGCAPKPRRAAIGAVVMDAPASGGRDVATSLDARPSLGSDLPILATIA
jgi:hypothetical protein